MEAKLIGSVTESEVDSTDIRLNVASDDDARVDVSDYFSDEAGSEAPVDGTASAQPDLLKPIRDNTVIPLSKDSLARRSKEEPSFGVVGIARTPGDMLTEVRQTRNLTIEAIADELHLRREVVEALEQDRAEEVAGATYARGYLKTYARYLNIEDDVVQSWFQDPELSAEDKPSKISNTRTSVVKSNRTGGLGSVVMLLLTISVASAAWFGYKQDWFSRAIANNSDTATDRVRLGPDGDRPVAVMSSAGEVSSNESTNDAVPDSVEAQSELSDTTSISSEDGSKQQPQSSKKQIVRANGSLEIDFGSSNADQTQPLSAPVSTEVVSSQSTDLNPAAQNAPQSDSFETIPEPVAASDPPETVSGGFSSTSPEVDAGMQGYRTVATGATAGTLEATVKLRGKSDSWVEISDATGKKIFLDMVHTSEVYNVHGQPPFKLLIGNAPGVDVEYEGYWVDVMGNTNDNNVARLILGDNAG